MAQMYTNQSKIFLMEKIYVDRNFILIE